MEIVWRYMAIASQPNRKCETAPTMGAVFQMIGMKYQETYGYTPRMRVNSATRATARSIAPVRMETSCSRLDSRTA